jgi:mannosyltransferase
MSTAIAPVRTPPGAPARRGEQHRESWLTVAAVAVPTLVAFALCLYDISSRSLWLDEAATVAIATRHGAAFGAALARDGGNMLGYYALLHVLIGAFGKGALVLRLPSLVGAVSTVGITGVLALRLFGRRVAFAAGLLTAVSLPLVYWGQNARGYSLMVALIAASFLALTAAVQSDRSIAWWVVYGVSMVAAVYAGLEAALVIPAQLVVLIWHRERWRAFAATLVLVAACCAPLAVLAGDRGSGQLFWVPGPSFTTTKQIVQSLASTGLQPNFYTSTGNVLLALTAVVLVLGLVRIGSLLRDPARHGAARGPMLALAWLVVPFLFALLESVLGQSIFQARYLLVSLPAVSLLLAWTALGRGAPVALGTIVVVALVALRTLQLAPAYGVSPEDWRAATSYVVGQARPGDCVAFYPLDNRMPFQYYLASRGPAALATAPRPILPAVPWTQVRAYVEDYASLSAARLSELGSRCTRVWLLSSHEGAVGGPPVSRANHARLQAMLAALGRDYPRTASRTFGTAHTIALTMFTGVA